MPRKSLPQQCKRMKTLAVCLTNTTEEEIWNHLLNSAQKYIDEAYTITVKQSTFITNIYNNNPYLNFSWRNRTPSRVKWDEWMENNENIQDIIISHFDFKHDWSLCVKAFDWNNEDVIYWDFEIKKNNYNVTSNEEFEVYERMHYNNSKKEWEIKDADWIIENKLKQDHKTHNKNPDCKLCINEIEEDKKWELRNLARIEQQNKWNEEWKAKLLQDEKEKQENKELYECKHCNFMTYDEKAADIHEESKTHKKTIELMNLYCKDCSIQCKNQTDYIIHIHTKKHKVICGEIEKQMEFKCDKCNYVTGLKQNFEKHCSTKAHNEKVLL